MKSRVLITIMLLFFSMSMLTGCDPKLPAANIAANYTPNPLTHGSSADIEIIYPNTDGTAVVKWTHQDVEIISGSDVVEVSGLSITGLQPGTAILRVSVRANCSFMGLIIDKPVFSTELKVEVT